MMNKILLADDEVTFRETMQKVIQEEGMDVTAVGNGTDAINLITKQPFAVAILDIQMPVWGEVHNTMEMILNLDREEILLHLSP